MEKLILNIKDSSKLSFLIQLIKQFDFVEVEDVKKKNDVANYDFFKSAGLWKGRNIDINSIRKEAWPERE